MSTVELRGYQSAAIEDILVGLGNGSTRQVLSMATGLGKTVCFVEVARRIGGRCLVLVHRDELVMQTVSAFRRGWPEAAVGVVKAEQDEYDKRVVVASVQTLSNAKGRRLLRWGADHFQLVVVDEAHHAVAPSYERVISHLKPELLLGVTATPFRGDALSLNPVFDRVIQSLGLWDGIRAGYLVDIRPFAIRTTLSLDGVHSRGGEFDLGELSERVDVPERNEQVVTAYTSYAQGRRAIVFCVDVEHAQHIAMAFGRRGIRALPITGETPLEDRREGLRLFQKGEVQVLTNCMVFTEGFDAPWVECLIMARPTRSLPLFIQMLGRGTRPSPETGKQEMVLIDITDNSERHAVVSLSVILGIRKDLANGVAITQVVSEQREYERAARALVPPDQEGPIALQFINVGPPPFRHWAEVREDVADLEVPADIEEDPPTSSQMYQLMGFGWPMEEIGELSFAQASAALARHAAPLQRWAALCLDIWKRILAQTQRELPLGSFVRTALEAPTAPLSMLHLATDRQIGYLKMLGMTWPRPLTKWEASVLITLLEINRPVRPPSDRSLP